MVKKKLKKLTDKEIFKAMIRTQVAMEKRDARLAKLLRSVADILDGV